MKKLFFLLLLFPAFAFAQEGKTYITHTVAPKETLYSLGRQFNIHPKEIAAYNNLDFNQGLTIGQVIKIPAKGTPAPNIPPPVLVKEEVKPVAEKKATPVVSGKGEPLYHKVQKKETLYSISVQHGKVPIADIKKWNNLGSDGVKEGTNLIVGYKQTAETKPEPVAEVKKAEPPVVKEKAVEEVVKAKEDTRAAVPVVKEEKPVVKLDPPVVKETPVPASKNPGGGFFKSKYNSSDKRAEETGTGSVFKSTSGWEDGKYYCLHNNATAGSIIKITNHATQKTIYAKVLDVIPDLKQNSKIAVLVSNAAADELGAGENNFECTITY
ncbi:MAG: LysM peptidoglycan-binding domain-containing protein [Ferruginibacter sp.]